MVGLRRLDDLQRCVETVVADGVPGDMIEAGAWRGGASILMRATLDALGDAQRTVVVADSFQGFPAPQPDEDQELEENMSSIDYLAPSLTDVQSYFARFGVERGVDFVPGFFEDTLEQLHGRRWSLVRLDADGYNATRLALGVLYEALAAGGYLVIDDYFHPHLGVCRRAVDEFRAERGIEEPIERIDWTGARWRRMGAPSVNAPPASVTPSATADDVPATPRRAVGRPPEARITVREAVSAIPTDRELGLEAELAEARRRIAALEDELAGGQAPPRARLRRTR